MMAKKNTTEIEFGKMLLVPGFKGVYHRFSDSRPLRSASKFDRCYYISYKDQNGKKKWHKIGWASEGITPQIAEAYRADFVKAIRFNTPLPAVKTGQGYAGVEIGVEIDPEVTVEDFWEKKYTPWKEGQISGFRNLRGHFENWIKKSFGHRPIDQVTREHVDNWLNMIRNSNISVQTKKHIELTCREIFEKAMDYHLISQSPFARIKLTKVERDSNGRTEFFTDEQIGMILEEAQKNVNLHIYTLLALFHGLRLKEVIGIRWGEVSDGRGRCRVIHWTRLDQDDLKSSRLQDLEDRNPVHSGGFH